MEILLGVGESQCAKRKNLKYCPRPQGVAKECDGVEVGNVWDGQISLQINLIVFQDTTIQFNQIFKNCCWSIHQIGVESLQLDVLLFPSWI